MRLIERAKALQPELVELRRDLHRHPELAFQEKRTARIAAEAVESMGFRVRAALPDERELHHPRFDIDESVLPVGAAALAHCALTLLRTLTAGT